MKLITKAIMAKLITNAEDRYADQIPVLKLFNPTGAGTWLITQIEDEDTLYGLCDLGMGCPELGCVSLEELSSFKGMFGLGIEREMWFEGTKTLSEYAADARDQGRIAA